MTLADLDRRLGAWPGVTLDVKWSGVRAYLVGGRMFAVTEGRAGPLGSTSFKVATGHFLAMTDLEGVRPAKFMARHHWVNLEEPSKFGEEWLLARLREAYEIIAARRPRT